MDVRSDLKENRQQENADNAVAQSTGNRSHSTVSESDSLPDTDLEETRLAEIDSLVDTAADTAEDLRQRLRSAGAAARLADEIFEIGLQEYEVAQPEASDERQKRRQLTQAVGSRMDRVGQLLHGSILPALMREESIDVVDLERLSDPQQRWLRTRFLNQVFPLLTPLAVDSGRPFPQLESGSLTLLTTLHHGTANQYHGGSVFALTQVPDVLERWLSISADGQEVKSERWFDAQSFGPGVYVWSESLVRSHIGLLFPGMTVTGAYLFRILRSCHSPSGDGSLRPPSGGRDSSLVRLDVEESMPIGVRQWLARHLFLSDQALVRSQPPMAMAGLAQIADRLSLRKRGIRSWLQSVVDLFFGHI